METYRWSTGYFFSSACVRISFANVSLVYVKYRLSIGLTYTRTRSRSHRARARSTSVGTSVREPRRVAVHVDRLGENDFVVDPAGGCARRGDGRERRVVRRGRVVHFHLVADWQARVDDALGRRVRPTEIHGTVLGRRL